MARANTLSPAIALDYAGDRTSGATDLLRASTRLMLLGAAVRVGANIHAGINMNYQMRNYNNI